MFGGRLGRCMSVSTVLIVVIVPSWFKCLLDISFYSKQSQAETSQNGKQYEFLFLFEENACILLTLYLSIGLSSVHGYILLTKTGIHCWLKAPNMTSVKPKFLDMDNSDQRTGRLRFIGPLPGRQCSNRISTLPQ